MERSDATVYKGKMGCCMRGDKEGGVPSIRAARRDESERGGGMGSKGPRASERAFPMCRNITLGFPGKRDYGTAINRAQRRWEEGTDGAR